MGLEMSTVPENCRRTRPDTTNNNSRSRLRTDDSIHVFDATSYQVSRRS